MEQQFEVKTVETVDSHSAQVISGVVRVSPLSQLSPATLLSRLQVIAQEIEQNLDDAGERVIAWKSMHWKSRALVHRGCSSICSTSKEKKMFE